jgi:hypothetical protein
MKIALDYTGKIPGAILKAAGYTEVFRYLTDLDRPDLWPKGLTQPEVDDLRFHRIKVHLNRETTKDFMLGGYSKGLDEARKCRAWARRLGFADDEKIIYSADFQVNSAQQALIDEFNLGVAHEDGQENVWNYGQYSVVKRCLDLGYGGGWQITNSWSWDANRQLQKDPRAYAYQLIGGVSVGGVDCDRNELNPNYKPEVIVAKIPDTIAKRWPDLSGEFPPNADFDDSNAIIWADAGARYAAKRSDEILAAVKAIPAGGATSISDADVDRIAHRLLALYREAVDNGIQAA